MKAAALILALAASSAQAQFVDGNELYERMITTGPKLLNAQGYIMGVADAALGTEWCPPPTVTMRQVFDMTKRTLEAVPEKRHEKAAAFVLAAVNMQWPCKVKSKGATL